MKELIDNALKKYKKKGIAIYGTGLNAERVLRTVKGYQFVCVISNDSEMIGKDFFGLRVMTLKEALLYADIILIAAIPSSARAVYERIKNKVPADVPIIELSGIQLNKSRGYMSLPYWDISYNDLLNAIDEHEVISFDAFDTLFVRRIVNPKTIFDIIDDLYVEKHENRISGFFNKRLDMENKMYAKGKNPTIYDIYSNIRGDGDLSEKQITDRLNFEIVIEKKILSIRKSLFDAFTYALSKKKKIYIVSDMYLTKQILNQMFSDVGIFGYTDILVSCEQKCSKFSGELFNKLINISGTQNILHIGDHYDADIVGAKAAGIDAFRILSVKDILLSSSVSHILNNIGNKWDELLLGQIISNLELFNNPFTLGKYKGKVLINSIETMTDLCFVPITVEYIAWLIQQLRGKEKSIVLFCSRDGYILNKIYEEIKESNPELNLPESKYFYTSRKAMLPAILADEEGIKALYSNVNQYRKVEILTHLERIFDVSLKEELKEYDGKYFNDIDQKKLLNDILILKDKIINHANKKRRGYLKYIESLGLGNYEKIYVVDLVAQGSSRYGLSKLCNKEVTLLALGTTKLPNAFIEDECLVHSMYGEMITGIGNSVSTMFNLLELVYASMDGQLIGFTPKGIPQFDDTTKYNVELLNRVQSRIFIFIHSYLDDKWFIRDYSPKLANDMLGILHCECSDVGDELWKYFDFQDPLHETSVRHNALEVARGEAIK